MAARSVEVTLAVGDAAWDTKRKYYDVISEAYYYAAPGLDPYLEGSGDETSHHLTEGQRRQDHIFDVTLPTDAEDHANEMCSETFPAGRSWAKLERGDLFAGDDEPPARQREAMKATAEKIFRAIHASNFYLALNTMAMDAVVAGTGLMKGSISRDSAALLDFEAVSQAEVALEPGARGSVGGYHRKMDLTRDEIRTYWPQATGLPEVDRLEKNGKPRHYRVVESVYYDLDDGIWREQVILRSHAKGTGDSEIWTREYMVCPWICWRYALLPGEVQGRSPVFKAVPGARTINHAKRVRLETASIRAVPAYTFVGEEVFNPNTVEIGPGVFIPVGSNDPSNPTIRPLEMAGDVPLNELVISDERQAIHETMARNAMPDPSGAVRSATEWLKREEQHLKKKHGPVLRMMEEVGRPVLRLVAFLLQSAGQLSELAALGRTDAQGRPVPFRLDGTDVKVTFSNPLVQLQQISDALQVFNWAQGVMQSFGPEGLVAGVAVERGAEVVGELMDIDERLIRRQDDQQAMLEQAMQQGGQPPGGQPQGGMPR